MSHTPKFPESLSVLSLINEGIPASTAYVRIFGKNKEAPKMSAVLADVGKLRTYKQTKTQHDQAAAFNLMVRR